MNSVSLIGRLTRDVEVKQAGKTQVANFTLAVSGYKDKTDFINCVAFGGWATNLAKFGKKGMRVSVLGSINTGSYQKDGETIYTTNVSAREVKVLETVEQSQEQEGDSIMSDEKADLPF